MGYIIKHHGMPAKNALRFVLSFFINCSEHFKNLATVLWLKPLPNLCVGWRSGEKYDQHMNQRET